MNDWVLPVDVPLQVPEAGIGDQLLQTVRTFCRRQQRRGH